MNFSQYNVKVSENQRFWLVLMGGEVAARFSKRLYTVTAARIYAAGMCIEQGLRSA